MQFLYKTNPVVIVKVSLKGIPKVLVIKDMEIKSFSTSPFILMTLSRNPSLKSRPPPVPLHLTPYLYVKILLGFAHHPIPLGASRFLKAFLNIIFHFKLVSNVGSTMKLPFTVPLLLNKEMKLLLRLEKIAKGMGRRLVNVVPSPPFLRLS